MFLLIYTLSLIHSSQIRFTIINIPLEFSGMSFTKVEDYQSRERIYIRREILNSSFAKIKYAQILFGRRFLGSCLCIGNGIQKSFLFQSNKQQHIRK